MTSGEILGPADDSALDRALDQFSAPPMPDGLAARIIATVPGLPQLPPEEDDVAPAAVPSPAPARWRRYVVPVGLGGLAAAAASLAAVFLSGAQGWQAPAMGAPDSAGPAVAAAAPSPAPSLAALPNPAASVPAPAHLPTRQTPAATPVLAIAKTPAAPASPATTASDRPAESGAPVLAAGVGNPEAAEPPISQISPAEAAEIERRNARRAAREESPVPGASPAPALGIRATPVSTRPDPR